MPPKYKTLSFVVCSMALAASASAFVEDLKVGSKAPELKVSEWVKGEPVKGFEAGKIYVVEFWATWCGPCKTSIPHLTELAKKNKDVVFIGVDSFERPSDNLEAVKKFVSDMGDKMDYRVAVDGSAAFMATNWMEAAKQQGIPTAFVVGKDLKIAWIGHPMEMEEPLGQIIAGTYDSSKEGRLKAHFQTLQTLVEKGDFKGAIKELDATFVDMPEVEKQLGVTKFEFMAQVGDPGTNAYAKKLFENIVGDDAIMLNQVAWFLVDDEKNYKGADYDLAIKIATKACDLTKSSDASLMDTLGYAYFKKGNIDKAIEVQEKAVKLAEADAKVPDETKDELRDRLVKFKKAKKGGQA